LRDEIRADATELRQEAGRQMAVLRRHQSLLRDPETRWPRDRHADGDRLGRNEALGRARGDGAEVLDGLAGARAALKAEAVRRPHAERGVDAIPVKRLTAVVVRGLHLVIDDAEQGGVDVVESRDGIPSAAGKPG